ncbi:hypothetical protein ACO2Q3_12780 [Caulobacter sp. KR2-114]|uniref:hypothetical protein n=1 Tax=Caulobacter sp. KR2-114 TaxID=3400912 RepID=UPI003C01142C
MPKLSRARRLAATCVPILLLAGHALAADPPDTPMAPMPGMEGMPGMGQPAPAQPSTPPAPPADKAHDQNDMSGMAMPAAGGGRDMMSSPFGDYLMMRDASGTSWQPDATPHEGVMTMAGDWMVMGHALINLVYDGQGGPRGGHKAFLAGMVMGMAQRPLGGGTLGLRAMLSPDPFMGPAGYPLLLATGETADGKTPLVDRQHPHDLFMELSASYSHPIGRGLSLYVYGGLPGEPAFGPPAFMHRASGLDSPEAPISHHWLDSTHITFGVVTVGLVDGDWKLEASGFRGREPDQHRYDIESPHLDSASVRLSWNPTPEWALQASWANIVSPEQLEPDVNERRVSASAIYTRRVGDGGLWATTLAYGHKDITRGPGLGALLLESAYRPDDRWTVFTRAEWVQENELAPGVHPVGKLSVGAIRDFAVARHVKVGAGVLVSGYALPQALKAAYGGPVSGMGFLRLKIE